MYLVTEYPADGHAPESLYRAEHGTLDEARADVARRLGGASLADLRWPDPGALESYHASEDEGCGGYAITAS